MKKLLLLVVIITLPLITYFQYQKYKRFNPPTDYEYIANKDIDTHYHDYALVEEYYTKVVEISAYARSKWANEGIDVRFPDEGSETEVNISKYYNEMLSRVKWIESKLVYSFELKKQGLGNKEIFLVESGTPINLVKLDNRKYELINLKIGDIGESVWLLQKQLVNRAAGHKTDGVFGVETQQALLDFQTTNDLYPSGAMNESTYKLLFIK